MAEPLNKLLKKDTGFKWSDACKKSFGDIKRAFAHIITLAYPNFVQPFIVDCDASDFGIGDLLSQIINREESQFVFQPIVVKSRAPICHDSQGNACASRLCSPFSLLPIRQIIQSANGPKRAAVASHIQRTSGKGGEMDRLAE